MSGAIVPRPERRDTELWIDEAIWGHRLYDEQTPWMTFLEMLGVLHASSAPDGLGAFRERPGGGLEYRPARRMAVRNILFNSPFIDELARKPIVDAERWKQWLARMAKEAKGVRDATDFSYVQRLFNADGATEGSFEDFAEVVRLLRSTAIEGDSNKRWTSKFVFPYGPDCLFVDLRLKTKAGADDELDVDRRFFARTGELVYLMLCRSGKSDELAKALHPLVLDRSRPWNRLVARLQPPTLSAADEKPLPIGYLPYAQHDDFGAFADDLLALLSAKLPGYDVLPHLVDVIGLHLVLYILRRAAERTRDGDVRLVLEIIAPRRTTVRDLAVQSFSENNGRSAKAVDAYITTEVEQSAAWKAAWKIADEDERRTKLCEALGAVVSGDVSKALPVSLDQLLPELRKKALKRHEDHVGETHASYAQAIGLASRRGTRRLRYAPSDQLLKTLVLVVVRDRMEFQQFLEKLRERYGMVIGHRQAAELVRGGGSDRDAFEENARRLERRLASLGLLRRLSDACAFVENPMRGAR